MLAHALVHERDAELSGALCGRGGRPRRQEPDVEAKPERPHDGRTVLDVEQLAFRAVRVQQQLAVGEDAVDVEQDEPDFSGSCVHGAVLKNISIHHRSCRCTTPATLFGWLAVGDDDRRDLALLHDVQRFGCQRGRRHGHRIPRHDVAGGHREDVGAALHVTPKIAVRDDAEQRVALGPSTTQVMPRPLLDIS